MTGITAKRGMTLLYRALGATSDTAKATVYQLLLRPFVLAVTHGLFSAVDEWNRTMGVTLLGLHRFCLTRLVNPTSLECHSLFCLHIAFYTCATVLFIGLHVQLAHSKSVYG